MPFVPKEDFKYSISISVLDALTGSDDAIVEEMTNEAVTEMKAFLNTRFDVVTIFSDDGAEKDKTLTMLCRDIALYHIYSIYNFRSIPENRKLRYKKALQWLQDVN